MSKPKIGAHYVRRFNLQRDSLDEEKRTVEVSLSSEAPVNQGFGNEILEHSSEAIDMSRASEGLPMLFRHREHIGRIEEIRLDGDKKLRGIARFSENTQLAREVFADVKDGFLRDFSIGAKILEVKESSDSDDLTISRWMPLEASVVPVPADATVGVNRQHEGNSMPTETPGSGTAPDEKLTVANLKSVRERNLKDGQKLGAEGERERMRAIRDLFSPYLDRGREFNDLLDACLDGGETKTRSMELLLEMVGEQSGGVSQTQFVQRGESMQDVSSPIVRQGRQAVQSGADEYDKFVDACQNALSVRANLATDDQRRDNAENEFRGMTMVEMARVYLDRIQVSTRGMDRRQLVGSALTRAGHIGHTTSDFANLLSNTANKALQVGYEEAPETWSVWAGRATTSDFKIFERPNLSGFSDLAEVSEAGEYEYGKFLDEAEQAKLVTYGKLFSITRQAIINDDLSAMTAVPRSMGRAANRKIGDLVYGVLTANANMADGNALFDATNHSNYNASGAVPAVATIEAVRVAMATQTDPNGNTLNIRPAYLICPIALEGSVRVLQVGQYDPAGTAGTLIPNTVSGTFEVVSDPRLDADDANDWYMASAPSAASTIEVTFLEGAETPYLEEQQGWNVDGVEYKVRIDAVAKALNWRGVYKVAVA